MKSIPLADVAATGALAARLIAALPEGKDGWMVLLKGELGAGKTSLARAMLREMGYSGPVPSPTYTLVEPYELAGGTVYHIDLYRIADAVELEYLGWDELRDGLVLLEWPERAPQLLAEADLQLELIYVGDGRMANLQGLSARGGAVLEKIGL